MVTAKVVLQHVRYQYCGLDRFTVDPAVLGRIGIELFLEKLREQDSDLHRTLLGQRTKFQISHGFTSPITASVFATRHFGPEAARTWSRLTITRTGSSSRMAW
jgi:hypothetical protein